MEVQSYWLHLGTKTRLQSFFGKWSPESNTAEFLLEAGGVDATLTSVIYEWIGSGVSKTDEADPVSRPSSSGPRRAFPPTLTHRDTARRELTGRRPRENTTLWDVFSLPGALRSEGQTGSTPQTRVVEIRGGGASRENTFIAQFPPRDLFQETFWEPENVTCI